MKKQQKNASSEGIVRYAHGSNFEAVVFDDFMGFPYRVSFLGDRWWLTTPGELLKPLEEFLDLDDVGFRYLCEAGGEVGAMALALMLGRALEQPESDIKVVLASRIQSLKRLGVTLNVEDETLLLEVRIFAHDANSRRQGRYSVRCCHLDSCAERLFDLDAFDTEEDAKRWVDCYFAFLRNIGIKFTIIYKV